MAGNAETWWRRTGTQKKGFRYIGANGRRLTSAATLERIRKLVIPPAWTDVHISPDPDRKIQVFGWDQAGRKQYRYSAEHTARTDRRKWRRVLKTARLLPDLRAATNEHLQRPGLDREKVLATVVRLMTRAYLRSGSERYAVDNQTFGICTLTKRHVSIEGNSIVFRYIGKSSKYQRQVVADTPLVEVMEQLLAQPGARLFKYPVKKGRRTTYRPVTAAAVNRYLFELLAGERCTSKDLRTFGGTVRAATILADIGPARTAAEAKRNVVLTCKLVAAELGNTPAICRKAYIHPAVLEVYEEAGRTAENAGRRGRAKKGVSVKEPVGWYPEEVALVRFLERYG